MNSSSVGVTVALDEIFNVVEKELYNKYLKAKTDDTNQKNDLFNFGLKLDRHPSTVDFKPYMRIYFDLQRIGSTNSDLHECGNHLGVGKKEKKLFAMPLFFIEEFISNFFE